MLACDVLARIGYDALLAHAGGPSVPAWADDDDPAAREAAREAARLEDHRRVREMLTAERPQTYANGSTGWRVAHLKAVTWPDRVPGLVTWAGQVTLAKIIARWQDALTGGPRKKGREAPECPDLFAFEAYEAGATGLDAGVAPDAIDAGFSPGPLGLALRQRPGVELLAVVGLECVPLLVSHSKRVCGFVHGGRLWRYTVEPRDGGYYHRWGEASEWLVLPGPGGEA